MSTYRGIQKSELVRTVSEIIPKSATLSIHIQQWFCTIQSDSRRDKIHCLLVERDKSRYGCYSTNSAMPRCRQKFVFWCLCSSSMPILLDIAILSQHALCSQTSCVWKSMISSIVSSDSFTQSNPTKPKMGHSGFASPEPH